MSPFIDVAAAKQDVAKTQQSYFSKKQAGIFIAFSMAVLTLHDALLPEDSDGSEELIVVFVLFLFAIAVRHAPWHQKTSQPPSKLDFVSVRLIATEEGQEHTQVTPEENERTTQERHKDPETGEMVGQRELDTKWSAVGKESAPVKPRRLTVVVDPPSVAEALAAKTALHIVSKLGNAARVAAFFECLATSGLEPSETMRSKLMTVCSRGPDACRAENSLTSLLKISAGADIDALTAVAESCAQANDLGLSADNLQAAYRALVHACVLVD